MRGSAVTRLLRASAACVAPVQHTDVPPVWLSLWRGLATQRVDQAPAASAGAGDLAPSRRVPVEPLKPWQLPRQPRVVDLPSEALQLAANVLAGKPPLPAVELVLITGYAHRVDPISNPLMNRIGLLQEPLKFRDIAAAVSQALFFDRRARAAA